MHGWTFSFCIIFVREIVYDLDGSFPVLPIYILGWGFGFGLRVGASAGAGVSVWGFCGVGVSVGAVHDILGFYDL